ncbi:unnamed protein product, partial [Larinioides sclopetarius]
MKWKIFVLVVSVLLPFLLLPLALSSYEEGYMTFIGAVMAAIAVEDSNLHERIALKILLLVGTKIKQFYLGSDEITFSSWMMYNVPG